MRLNKDSSHLLLAVKENVLMYDMESKSLHSKYEGHADTIQCLNFATKGTSFVSSALNEGFVNVWKQTEQGSTSSNPFKMLEVGSRKTPSEVNLFHLESEFYCATATLDSQCAVFLVNLKKKKGKLVQSPDTSIQLTHAKRAQGLLAVDF